MRIHISCSACGSTQVAAVSTGDVAHVAVEHEDTCPFLKAVEDGAVEQWIAEHGNPITHHVEGEN